MSEVTPEARKVLAQCYAYLLSLPDPSEDETKLPESTQAKPQNVLAASNDSSEVSDTTNETA
ncbi:MAG: hypothetical protein ACP5J4_19220 [Anaerolineae bacterium]